MSVGCEPVSSEDCPVKPRISVEGFKINCIEVGT